jgi:hypothetical protein
VSPDVAHYAGPVPGLEGRVSPRGVTPPPHRSPYWPDTERIARMGEADDGDRHAAVIVTGEGVQPFVEVPPRPGTARTEATVEPAGSEEGPAATGGETVVEGGATPSADEATTSSGGGAAVGPGEGVATSEGEPLASSGEGVSAGAQPEAGSGSTEAAAVTGDTDTGGTVGVEAAAAGAVAGGIAGAVAAEAARHESAPDAGDADGAEGETSVAAAATGEAPVSPAPAGSEGEVRAGGEPVTKPAVQRRRPRLRRAQGGGVEQPTGEPSREPLNVNVTVNEVRPARSRPPEGFAIDGLRPRPAIEQGSPEQRDQAQREMAERARQEVAQQDRILRARERIHAAAAKHDGIPRSHIEDLAQADDQRTETLARYYEEWLHDIRKYPEVSRWRAVEQLLTSLEADQLASRDDDEGLGIRPINDRRVSELITTILVDAKRLGVTSAEPERAARVIEAGERIHVATIRGTLDEINQRRAAGYEGSGHTAEEDQELLKEVTFEALEDGLVELNPANLDEFRAIPGNERSREVFEALAAAHNAGRSAAEEAGDADGGTEAEPDAEQEPAASEPAPEEAQEIIEENPKLLRLFARLDHARSLGSDAARSRALSAVLKDAVHVDRLLQAKRNAFLGVGPLDSPESRVLYASVLATYDRILNQREAEAGESSPSV